MKRTPGERRGYPCWREIVRLVELAVATALLGGGVENG
jgi:hypothetical protein